MEMHPQVHPGYAYQPVYVPVSMIAPVFVNAVTIALPMEYSNT